MHRRGRCWTVDGHVEEEKAEIKLHTQEEGEWETARVQEVKLSNVPSSCGTRAPFSLGERLRGDDGEAAFPSRCSAMDAVHSFLVAALWKCFNVKGKF